MLQVLVIVFTALFTFISVSHADQCPNLEGHYTCAVRGNPTRHALEISQEGSVRSIVQYTWAYDGGARIEFDRASPAGESNLSRNYGICRNKFLYLSKSLNDLSDASRHWVNKVGNYVVTTFTGQPLMTCTDDSKIVRRR